MNDAYAIFIAQKTRVVQPAGHEVQGLLSPRLRADQSDIVRWAVRMGRAGE